MAKSAQLETAQGFFDDLLTMEINVILKPGMTARKMPNTMEAFQDVAANYARYLPRARTKIAEAGAEHDVDVTEATIPDEPDALAAVTPDLFDQLATRAGELHDAGGELYGKGVADEGRGAILSRIKRNSRILESIMPALPEGATSFATDQAFTSDQGAAKKNAKLIFLAKENLIQLRKAWEVGTENVIMQTTAQLDGDIVTRIQEDKAGQQHAALHDVHLHMVGESLQHWRFLFATVASFTLGVFQSFFGQRG